MYGDVGHGLFLFCAGLFLLYKEKENDNAKLGEMGEGLQCRLIALTLTSTTLP